MDVLDEVLDTWRELAVGETVNGARVRFYFSLSCLNTLVESDIRRAIAATGLPVTSVDATGILSSLFIEWDVEFQGFSGTPELIRSKVAEAVSALNSEVSIPCVRYQPGAVFVHTGRRTDGIGNPVASFGIGALVALVLVAVVAWKVR